MRDGPTAAHGAPRSPMPAGPYGNVVPGPGRPGLGEHPLKSRTLAGWAIVKAARFNAAKRLERKQSAGTVTLAIVALYGGLISVFNLMFKHRVGGDARDVLEYVAVVSSWLTLIIGLTETMKGHGANGRELHDCARDVNTLSKQLAATPIYDEQHLQPFLARYREIIERCRPNHESIDYRLAELEISRAERERLRQRGDWDEGAHDRVALLTRLRFHLMTYWFYVVIWVTPPLVGLMLWWLVPASPAA